jgi:hypothetical protein
VDTEVLVTRFRACLALAVGLLFAAAPARAQLPSTYSGAAVLPVNGHFFGAYVPISSNAVGALAQLRLSFLPSVDFGFQGGLSRLDRSAGSKTVLRLGTDVKFAVSTATPERPITVALGAALGVISGDDYNVLTVGPNLLASRTWNGGQTGEFTGYVGAGLAISTIDAGPFNDTDFSIPLRIGAEVGVTPAARLVGEFVTRIGSDFGDDGEFTLGVNLPF